MQIPLHLDKGHLFLDLAGSCWLYDTGAPTSFGDSSLTLGGKEFKPSSNYMGLSASTLSDFTEVRCQGLLGGDILGEFDHIIDMKSGMLTVSADELEHSGVRLAMEEFMGIPIVEVDISGTVYKMFFDTGAQISYFQGEGIKGFPDAGAMSDFYPGFGRFETETHLVEVLFGGETFQLRCGTLPGLLGMTLMMAETSGIIGNAILNERTMGYFPRRKELSF